MCNSNVNRIAPYWFLGAKYAVTPQIDVTGAFYYQQQTDYNSSTTPCANAKHDLHRTKREQLHRLTKQQRQVRRLARRHFVLIDYRPVKRVDLYAGVMISNIYGGLANGYQAVQNIAPTAGLRVRF